MNDGVSALPDPGTSAAQQAEVTDRTADIIAATLVKLRRLPIPAGESVALRRIYAKVDLLRAAMPRLSAALRSGNRVVVRRAEAALEAVGNAANAASNRYGLTVCGS